MKNIMNIRDIVSLPILFLGLFLQLLASKIGGRWTNKIIKELEAGVNTKY